MWWASPLFQQLGWNPDTSFVCVIGFHPNVSKMCHFKLGQYHLAPLNSPQEEAYKHLFEGLLSYLGLEEP